MSHLGEPRCAAESHCCSLGNRSHSKDTSLPAAPSVLFPAQATYLQIKHTHKNICDLQKHHVISTPKRNMKWDIQCGSKQEINSKMIIIMCCLILYLEDDTVKCWW